jgi:hypothetical protein
MVQGRRVTEAHRAGAGQHQKPDARRYPADVGAMNNRSDAIELAAPIVSQARAYINRGERRERDGIGGLSERGDESSNNDKLLHNVLQPARDGPVGSIHIPKYEERSRAPWRRGARTTPPCRDAG